MFGQEGLEGFARWSEMGDECGAQTAQNRAEQRSVKQGRQESNRVEVWMGGGGGGGEPQEEQ